MAPRKKQESTTWSHTRTDLNASDNSDKLRPEEVSHGNEPSKKGGKGGAAADGPKASSLSKEVKASTVVGGNILKEGTDPKILPDSEYPDWLWHLLDKRPALSELRRKDIGTLPYEDLKRYVKLDNRARIKENNSLKAKN
ncbi:hypothetical protein P8452_51430 [Trifolium repens]|nr:hypothetical protein P8452_51430 [Trifolium repens]